MEEWIRELPDRVGVAGDEGPVGFMRKADYLEALHLTGPPDTTPPGTRPPEPPIEVFDEDDRLVGHMYFGHGFVSIEESSAPGFDPSKLEVAPTTTVVTER